MKSNEIITTYEPDNVLKKGYLSIFREIYQEIRNSGWLTLQLFKREFLAIYKESFIGIFWAFIMPIVSVGTFIILNRSGIFIIGEIDIPYPIYALLGMAFWQLFSTGLIASSNSLIRGGGMITRVKFSKKSLVFASTGHSIVSFLIQFAAVCILFLIYKTIPSIKILLTPLLVLPIILLALGLGFILSVLAAVIKDIPNILSLFMSFLMFLTPILYTKPMGVLGKITRYNPLYYLVISPRNIILFGEISHPKGFLGSIILSGIVFVVCLVIFHLAETRVAERI